MTLVTIKNLPYKSDRKVTFGTPQFQLLPDGHDGPTYRIEQHPTDGTVYYQDNEEIDRHDGINMIAPVIACAKHIDRLPE